MEIKIRRTDRKDLEAVMKIYRRAALFMAETGNPGQWTGGYPSKDIIEAEIETGDSYVVEGAEILGVFSFLFGEDLSYRKIEAGSWRGSGLYGTVHRLASSGRRHGIAQHCFEWCADLGRQRNCTGIRADTHMDNRIMQHLLEEHGFVRRGIIYLPDGAPRIACERLLTG